MKNRRIGIIMCLMLTMLPAAQAMAGDGMYMPKVEEKMCGAAYWAAKEPYYGNEVLAELSDIEAINQMIVETPECCMTDLRKARKYYHQKSLYRSLWASTFSDAMAVTSSIHYGMNGKELSGAEIYELMGNVGAEEGLELAKLQYGICVRRTDMLALPTDALATDVNGDIDYNFFQISALRVNEPVTVKAVSKDGSYYYCDADCVSGWVPSEDIAVCEDKEDWLEAWDIPNEEAVVVTQSRIHLEESNINPAVNGVVLPMGTVLRKVPEEEYDASVTGRQLFQNTAVWLPVRREDGTYAKTIALISQNQTFSEGYLPLTTRNILKVAFSKLGEVYGWGSMLDSVDCSNYIRDIYKCFGLSLARNTTWQSAMPVFKYDVSSSTDRQKEDLLRTLPAGTILYFNGHEMLYLGEAEGNFYVISALGSVKDFSSDDILNVRSIVVNALDLVRPNGNTWLKSIDTMLVPYLTPEAMAAENQEEDTESTEEAGTESAKEEDTDNAEEEEALSGTTEAADDEVNIEELEASQTVEMEMNKDQAEDAEASDNKAAEEKTDTQDKAAAEESTRDPEGTGAENHSQAAAENTGNADELEAAAADVVVLEDAPV